MPLLDGVRGKIESARLRSLTNHNNNVEGNKHNKTITNETRICARAYTANGDFQGQTKSEEIPPTKTRFRTLRIRSERRETVGPRVLARRIPIANDTAKTMIKVTTNEFMKSLLPQRSDARMRSHPTVAFSCGARSAFKLKEQGYLENMLSRRQLQGFVELSAARR